MRVSCGDRQSVLVTGGAGFIGSHLVDELLSRGHRVLALDNLRNGSMLNLVNASKSPDFTFVKGDVLNPDACSSAVKDINVVYHLACLGVRHSIHSPRENHRVNAEGTLNMLEAAKQHEVKRFFYISTSEIYGSTKMFPITEDALPCPNTIYGASKLAGEHYTNVYGKCYGLNSTIVRIFNNYGPRAHYEGDAGEIIPRTIVSILYGKQPVLFGDGSITRDFLYVKDTARALCLLMNMEALNNATLNVGTGMEISMKQVMESLLKIMGEEKLEIRYMAERPSDVPRLWSDASKFKRLTGFAPEVDFERGLKETVNYYMELSRHRDLLSQVVERNWVSKA